MRREAPTTRIKPARLSSKSGGAALATLCLVLSSPGLAAEESAGGTSIRSELEAQASGEGRLPSMARLFRLALDNDSDLASQRYELRATEKEIDKAWSELKPQVSGSASYTYQVSDNFYTDNPNYDPSNDRVSADNEARYEGETRDTSWQVSLSQPLFSVERWRGVDQAEAQVEAARLQLAVGESKLAMSVVEAYLNAFLASRKVGLLESKEESLELKHRQASRSFDLGVGDRINVLESQSRLDQAVADRIKAENQLDSSLSELERLTGLRPTFGHSLGDLQSAQLEPVEGKLGDWLEQATNNLEVELAERRSDVAEVKTEVRRAGHYPEVSLNLSYSDRGSNDPFRDSRDGQASVQLDVPIYQGGYTSANVRQGELSAMASQESLTNARRVARQEVRKRYRNINGNLRQLSALGQSIESSRLFLQAAEKGEQLGLRDLVDVLDARAELYDLRIQYIDSIRQYMMDRLHLELAIGDLASDDLMNVMGTLHALTRSSQKAD
ncbi:TolC family outer membrane protein [Halomonas sabkhae]|uniref:TolC family outer membrane protein n=1 Tax=Halomonas sabkhae TaxID=626223 RepID=UPI0025B58CB1|nr:TolC family outer membrane protein [Halomonas sabkhae]MDN3524157.1 TolC family outer membrane protein [Halomonas sabkhae]